MRRNRRIAISVSFGGTKIAVALVNCVSSEIVAQSERIEWSQYVHRHRGIGALIAKTTARLLRGVDVAPPDIDRVGIAWPGPGNYSSGEVQATFVPGFETSTNVFSILGGEFRKVLGSSLDPNEWRCYLDAMARARGELLLADGALNDSRFGSNLLVNIATGIAGALVRDGCLVTSVPGLGETYGQWGRFLIWNRESGFWQWRPTSDGSVPRLDPITEVRFTELCGGPALARAFADRCVSGMDNKDTEIHLMANKLLKSKSRSVDVERALLMAVTRSLDQGNALAAQFVRDTGASIGAALRCLRESLQLDPESSSVVLTGGIGENLGRPFGVEPHSDLLLLHASAAFNSTPDRWTRSRLGLSAELVGAVL